jgi:uncharacterized protein (TIGR00162 family)
LTQNLGSNQLPRIPSHIHLYALRLEDIRINTFCSPTTSINGSLFTVPQRAEYSYIGISLLGKYPPEKEAQRMTCDVEIFEKPELNGPVLVEGLPGIGFVANIATLHLIRELKATRFAEIHSSAFQDLAVTIDTGGARAPTNELYQYKSKTAGRDLILWYGSTQALTTFGQYELCGRILDIAKGLGCRYIVTLGGFKQDEIKTVPEIYSAATDAETLNEALALGTKIMVGQIFGVAGLLIGLGKLRGLRGFSLLVETVGTYPDANAARHALLSLNKFLDLSVDLSRLDSAVEETKRILESFGLVRSIAEEKKKEEQQFRWFI